MVIYNIKHCQRQPFIQRIAFIFIINKYDILKITRDSIDANIITNIQLQHINVLIGIHVTQKQHCEIIPSPYTEILFKDLIITNSTGMI